MSDRIVRRRVPVKPWSTAFKSTVPSLALCLGLAGATIPVTAGAQVTQLQTPPISVMLDLYTGDTNSKGFADGLTAAISDDERFQVVTALPADGMKIVMTDSLVSQNDDSRAIAAYDVVLKLGNGKYIAEKQGFCDLSALAMCGRVVAQDSYDAYQAYMAQHKPK